MSKDLELYKKFSSKIKEPIEKFIFAMINIVGKNLLKSKTIIGYIKNFKKAKKEPIMPMTSPAIANPFPLYLSGLSPHFLIPIPP